MAQVWILPEDIDPVTATHTGDDARQCGQCPLRMALAGRGQPRCYVAVGRAPLAVWKRYRAGRTPHAEPSEVGEHLASISRPVRLGAYGDPAAVPAEVWRSLLASGVSHTGYTHQWREPFARDLRDLLMASADSERDRRQATRAGWRTFRVMQDTSELVAGEILCPASREAGKRTTCAHCRLCNGRKRGDRRKTIAIVDHGPTSRGRVR